MLPLRIAVFGTACILVLANGISAQENGGEVAQLREEVERLRKQQEVIPELERKIQELVSAQPDTWLTEQRAAEIRSLVRDVLEDADTRASLQAAGATAGWDKGFFLASSDGNYRLKVGGQLQQRFVYNQQESSPSDDHRSGFETRRARLLFSGHIVDPSWTYDIQVAADRSTGNVALEDAGWIQKDIGDGWKVKFGQMKAPFLREETLSSQRMLAVERSLLNSQFTAGTVQGVQLGWEGDDIRVYGMFHDGNRTANTAWSAEDTEYAASARAEWLASGDWKTLNDYNSFRDEEGGVLVGGAINYSVGEYGTGSNLPAPDFNNAEVENLGMTIDATIDFGGASLTAVGVYRLLETDTDSPSDIDRDQPGFLIRGGFFIADDWELYGQYEWGDVDIAGTSDLSVVTIGTTRYWSKHMLKWQTDIGYGFDEVASTWASDGAGWRTDAAGEDGQLVLRSQFQLVF